MLRAPRLLTALLPLFLSLPACGSGEAPPSPDSGPATESPVAAPTPTPTPVAAPTPEVSEPASPDSPTQETGPAGHYLLDPSIPAGHLRVHVLRDEDGSPVAGISIRLLWKVGSRDAGRISKKTDETGLCDFEITGGTFLQSLFVGPTGATAPAALILERILAPHATEEVELRLHPGGILAGKVLDENGDPVADARLRVWFRDRWDLETQAGKVPPADLIAFSHEGGIFAFGGMDQGDFILEVKKEGLVCTRRLGGKIRYGQRVEGIELVMGEAQPFYGAVTDADGRPLEGVPVLAGPLGRYAKRDPGPVPGTFYYPSRQFLLQTDAAGSFTVEAMPTGEVWILDLKMPGYQPLRRRVLPGQSSLDLQLQKGYTLNGKVVDADGQPVRRPFLRLRGEQTLKRRGGVHGGIHIAGLLPDDEAALLVYKPGNAVAVLWPVFIGDDMPPLSVSLPPGFPLSGKLVDASGQAAAGLRVRVVRPLPSSGEALAPFPGGPPEEEFGLDTTLTTSDGSFSFVDLAAGEVVLRVEGADGRPRGEFPVRVGQRDLRIRLKD